MWMLVSLFAIALGVLVGMAAEWLWSQAWDLRILIRSTIFMRRLHAEARSRTPGGSANPGRRHPQRRPGMEAGDAEPPTMIGGAVPAASGAAVSHPRAAAPIPAPVSAANSRIGPRSPVPSSAGAGATQSPSRLAPAGSTS